MKLVNWNVKWATPRSKRSVGIVNRIDRHSPEIVCLTETHTELLRDGHTIGARSDYGYGTRDDRRKVLLWSREPWEQMDDVGDDRLPPGRFVSGVTRTSLGELTVIGLCIPWQGSRSGAKYSGERRRAWEDHEVYLEHLVRIVARAPAQQLVMMGDFNQTVVANRRKSSRPAHRAALLQRAIAPSVALATSKVEFCGRRTIDHVALSLDLEAESLNVISNIHGECKLSDHFGVVADVMVRGS